MLELIENLMAKLSAHKKDRSQLIWKDFGFVYSENTHGSVGIKHNTMSELALFWFVMQYFGLSCPAGKKDRRANTLLSHINPNCHRCTSCQNKNSSRPALYSKWLNLTFAPSPQKVDLFLKTYQRDVCIVLDSVSILASKVLKGLTFHV